MADIRPFRGVLYDPARVELSRVLAPPYDVIDDAERRLLAARDPHNVVRLIVPEGPGDERYQNAAQLLGAWQAEGALRRDDAPALYRYHQVFRHVDLGPSEVTRRGFISAVRLHPYDDHVIRPHERTLRGPKEDRLKLMRATRAHLSQIFGLYADPDRKTDAAFASAESAPPDLEGTTSDGTVHRLWRVTDAATIETIQKQLADAAVYIADGHHRYETMLALRDEMIAQGADDGVAYGTMFLANMDDPGLIVLPTHRLVHSLPDFSMDILLDRLRDSFAITTMKGGRDDGPRLRTALADAATKGPSFAAIAPHSHDAWILTLTGDAGVSTPPSLARLDVSVLHGLVLDQHLGIDPAALEAQTHLDYVKDMNDALARVAAGKAQAGFLMNATPVHQVREISDDRGVLPQKSTFFYPKIASGMVIRSLDGL